MTWTRCDRAARAPAAPRARVRDRRWRRAPRRPPRQAGRRWPARRRKGARVISRSRRSGWRGAPAVWLPAGGYSNASWKVLAGSYLAVSRRSRRPVKDKDPLMSRYAAVARGLDPARLLPGGPGHESLPTSMADVEAELYGQAARRSRASSTTTPKEGHRVRAARATAPFATPASPRLRTPQHRHRRAERSRPAGHGARRSRRRDAPAHRSHHGARHGRWRTGPHRALVVLAQSTRRVRP